MDSYVRTVTPNPQGSVPDGTGTRQASVLQCFGSVQETVFQIMLRMPNILLRPKAQCSESSHGDDTYESRFMRLVALLLELLFSEQYGPVLGSSVYGQVGNYRRR